MLRFAGEYRYFRGMVDSRARDLNIDVTTWVGDIQVVGPDFLIRLKLGMALILCVDSRQSAC
jgi:hypothetical protein